MEDNHVEQTGNTVYGDQAGRDIIKHVIEQTGHPKIKALYVKLQEEAKNNSQLSHFIEELEEYTRKIDSEIIGLEEKLKLGSRDYILEFASKSKEKFVKKLSRYQFSESAQKIFVVLLAETFTRFHRSVYPLICAGRDIAEVNDAISREISGPITKMLGENIMELCAVEVEGMLYFLTGNCHIKWSK